MSFVIILFKNQEKYFIQMTPSADDSRRHEIFAFSTLEKGLSFFADAKMRSVGLLLQRLYLQPALVVCENLQDVKDRLLDPEPHLFELVSSTGQIPALETNAEKAKLVWDSARKPE